MFKLLVLVASFVAFSAALPQQRNGAKVCPLVMCNLHCEYGLKYDSNGCVTCGCQQATDMTSCQQAAFQAEQNSQAGMMGAWKPTCKPNGEYEAKQCREGVCACVDSNGNAFSNWVSYPQAYNLNCECPRALYEATAQTGQNVMGKFAPKCTDEGLFNKVQCNGSTGFCWCVDQTSGVQQGNAMRGTPSC